MSAEIDSVPGTPRLKSGFADSSYSASWSYAAADGGVCGDLHHHGAHPEGLSSAFFLLRGDAMAWLFIV